VAPREWTAVFEPAVPVERVVDTTGAGDTFNAAVVAALAAGSSVARALADGCAVAGRKVQQAHFEGLGARDFEGLGSAALGTRKRGRDEA
jgi:sugar/nucleoside kinase (ribokinase family)